MDLKPYLRTYKMSKDETFRDKFRNCSLSVVTVCRVIVCLCQIHYDKKVKDF